MSLELINNPFFVTLQDRGRFSYTHLGVTNSGVMDEYSYLIANKLLGNSLEIFKYFLYISLFFST